MRRKLTVCIGIVTVLTAFAALPAMAASRTFDFDTPDYGANDNCTSNNIPPLFNRPGYAGQTSSFVMTPTGCGQGVANNGNDSQLTVSNAYSSPNSNILRFSWVDPTNDESWVRVVTASAGGVTPRFPNPTVYLGVGGKIRMRVALTCLDASENENPAGQVELSLLIRETGLNLPLGFNGGEAGPLELIGGTAVGVGNTPLAPVGGVPISHTAGNFVLVEWEILSATSVRVSINGVQEGSDRPVVNWLNGNGSFSGVPYSRGVLNALCIRKAPSDDITKKLGIWIDDLTIEAVGVTDPVRVVPPIPEFATSVTVTNVDPAATAVQLYKNGVSMGAPGLASPPNSPSHTFNFATPPWVAGDQISATQTVGGVESDLSAPVGVTATGVLEDFNNGVVAGHTGTDPRTWYIVHTSVTQSPQMGPATLNGSPAMKTLDEGFTNGAYAVFPSAVLSTGLYHVEADIWVSETPSGANGIRAYEMGAKVNGAHRTGDYLDPIVAGQPGQGVGSYAGLTSGYDSGLGTQRVSTTSFSASVGDSMLVAFSTNVDARYGSNIGNAARNWGHNDGSSATWSGSVVYIDNIELVGGGSCSDIPSPTVKTGPLIAGGGTVVVTDVNNNATEVKVYANGTTLLGSVSGTPPLGVDNGVGGRTVTVGLNEPLAHHQRITATQKIGGVESCVLSVGPQVGSGNNASLRVCLGIRETTGDVGPIGAPGGTSGSIEFLGASTKISGSPQGKPLDPSPNWQEFTFQVGVDPVVASGLTISDNGVLANSGFAVLEHLAIAAEPTADETGPYVLYIDNVRQESTIIRSYEGQPILFQQPSFSGSTNANMIYPPNVSVVTDEQAQTGSFSQKLSWQFIDEGDQRWLRATTWGYNPQIDLSKPITVSLLLLPPGPPPPVCPDPFADVDSDGDVDLDDFGAFQRCYTGSTPPLAPDPAAFDPVACKCFDRDNNAQGDGDVDSADFLKFQACWTGPAPANPVNPACDN